MHSMNARIICSGFFIEISYVSVYRETNSKR